MTTFLRKYQIQILTTILGGFLIYIALGFGMSFINHNTLPTDPVIEVNGDKIPLRIYQSHFDRAAGQLKAAPDDTQKQQIRQEAVRDLVQLNVFSHEAERYGIVVPDAQVAAAISNQPAFQTKGQFDPQMYGQALAYQLKTTPQDFEEEQRSSIAFFKLRWLFQSALKVTDGELAFAYAQQLRDPTYKGQPKPADKLGKPTGFFRPGSVDDREAFRDSWSQQKMMWSFNQWFTQIAQHIQVKTHFELVDGAH